MIGQRPKIIGGDDHHLNLLHIIESSPASCSLNKRPMLELAIQNGAIDNIYGVELTLALEEAVKDAGFVSLKTKQEEALKEFVSGKDTFVALPTGYGKSIIM